MEAVASGRQPKKEGSEGARGRWCKRARFPSCRNIIIFSLKRGYSELLKKCGRSVTLPSGRRHASGRRKRSYATGYPDEIS